MTEGTIVNGQFYIMRASKYWEQVIIFFNKLSKASQKGSLGLHKVENWTTVFCTELVEATW